MRSTIVSYYYYLIIIIIIQGGLKDMRKWAYEIHSCFLLLLLSNYYYYSGWPEGYVQVGL